MIINERKEPTERVKEVKVKIPITYHVKLHSMKVLTGKQISDAVTEALEFYFSHKRGPAVGPELLLDEQTLLNERENATLFQMD
ncbi:MAG TPA: hypothetical protein VNZ52_07975 [Candidatus Thermoplasmatota archaeon]|nr:hypothetical protein [Candidatus Thermoplasmatota archaeon]